ncbi:hypothetical protein ACU99_02660, partial [Escherichia coli]
MMIKMRQVNLPQLLPFLANPRHPMEQYDQIGARLDRLPLARFHYRIFGIISFSLLLTVNRPGFPGECFICELRLPDHR